MSLLDEAKAVVAQRVAATPQQITVWLPRSASAADERAAVENARGSAPPSVEVVARRYDPNSR